MNSDYPPPGGQQPFSYPDGTPVNPPKKSRKWLFILLLSLVGVFLFCGIGVALVAAAAPQQTAATAPTSHASSASPAPMLSHAPAPTLSHAPPVVPSPTKKAAPPPPPPVSINDGTWTVGEDIPPGKYKAIGASGDCYWAIYKSGTNQDMDSIITNHLGGGNLRVTLKVGQDFETMNCGTWTKVG